MLKKIFKYRLLIWYTVFLLSKYSLIRIVLSDKNLIAFLSSQSRIPIYKSTTRNTSSTNSLLHSVNKILKGINPNGNCLVHSLVKRDILYKKGYFEPIFLGLKITNQGLKAHAWLSNERVIDYNLVHLLS